MSRLCDSSRDMDKTVVRAGDRSCCVSATHAGSYAGWSAFALRASGINARSLHIPPFAPALPPSRLAALSRPHDPHARRHPVSADTNRKLLEQYAASNHEDLSMMADDVVFTTMATGDEAVGRDALREMLHHVYHVAFDAHAEPRAMIVDDSHAVLEATIVGRHIGEFAGVPATGKDVRIPLCVVYDFRDGKLHAAASTSRSPPSSRRWAPFRRRTHRPRISPPPDAWDRDRAIGSALLFAHSPWGDLPPRSRGKRHRAGRARTGFGGRPTIST